MPSLVLFLFASCLPTAWLMDQKALEEFVKLPDPHYQYKFLRRVKGAFIIGPVNLDTINLTSQKWLDESEVDKPVWSHQLHIAITTDRPKRKAIVKDSCLLIIRSGPNDELAAVKVHLLGHLLPLAEHHETVIAELMPVPSQPLTFYNHPLGHKNLTGLDLFAYSWWRFMNDSTAAPHVLVEFPMVKAIVRAMDTVTKYIKKKYKKDITRFVLTGVSTAGWVTWLAAAVDKRVYAIVPFGLDFLNFTESFHHHYRAYCGWSYMLKPFVEMNITQELDNPRFRELASHVDPLAYNERYVNISKYITIFSGDEFSQPDNSRNYFSQLEGMKYLQIIPNSDYGFQPKKRFVEYIKPFYDGLLRQEFKFPEVSWEIKMTNTSASISFVDRRAYKVFSYHTGTVGGTRRDFRMKIAAGNSTKNNPVKWIQTILLPAANGNGVYKAEIEKPENGWRALFLEVVFPGFMFHFIVTSEMVIVPDTFPCPDCEGEGCRGTLV